MIEHRGCCAAAGLGIDVSVIRGARRTAIGLAARVASSAVALLVASTLAALSQSAFDFTKSIDPLFAGVLAQPNNLNNTIQYAVTAASQGDIESAISAYEQLRFYNPMLAATRFQLAVLYYQLGSCDQARGYLQTALQMPDVTPELRQKIEDLLELVDKKLRPDQISGFAQTGLRYQTNASLGAGAQTVLASGATLNSNFVARPDWNWFGTVGVNYVHDFETQTGETFEASVLAYDAQQFTLHQFDIGLLELRAGPRFALSPGNINGLTVKPYVVATGALLADAPYMGGIGGGLTLHATVANVSLDPYAEVVRQSFRNSSFYPLASGLSGTLSTVGLQASGPIAAGLAWQSRFAYARASDQFAFDSYRSYAFDVWLPWTFAWPTPWAGNARWTLIPTAGMTTWRYDAPDPFVAPFTTANTTEWRVGLGLEVPIWHKLIFASLVQYRDATSNVAAFSYRDLSVSAGPLVRF
jgi:tetratricopeptide (TPR) repeat protein